MGDQGHAVRRASLVMQCFDGVDGHDNASTTLATRRAVTTSTIAAMQRGVLQWSLRCFADVGGRGDVCFTDRDNALTTWR